MLVELRPSKIISRTEDRQLMRAAAVLDRAPQFGVQRVPHHRAAGCRLSCRLLSLLRLRANRSGGPARPRNIGRKARSSRAAPARPGEEGGGTERVSACFRKEFRRGASASAHGVRASPKAKPRAGAAIRGIEAGSEPTFG